MKNTRESAMKLMTDSTKLINKEPLFKQINNKLKLDEESEIDKRKKHLQSLRDLRQTLDHDEILERSKKLEEISKEKAE